MAATALNPEFKFIPQGGANMDLIVKNGRRLGYIQNPPDHRDYTLLHPCTPVEVIHAASRLFSRAAESDNVIYMPPVKDQGDEGDCTANAGSENLAYLATKFPNYFSTKYSTPPVFSAQDLYWNERFLDNTLIQGDCGSTGRSSCMAMQQCGVCLESEFPTIPGQFDLAPTQDQVTAALKNKAGAFHALSYVGDVIACLMSGYPILMGFAVYNSFFDISSNGFMPTPGPSETIQGGHEVVIYDYKDNVIHPDGTTGVVFVQNSWGTSWGQNGRFIMSYRQLGSQMVWDLVMQHLGAAWSQKSNLQKAA